MFKVYSHIQNRGTVWNTIVNGFLDFMPCDRFAEVDDIKAADILMMSGVIRKGNFYANCAKDISLANCSAVAEELIAIDSCYRVIWIDTMGPSVHRDKKLWEDTGLRETDILISSSTIPDWPNTFTHFSPIEKSVFREYGRFHRKKNSVMIMRDNLETELDWMVHILPVVSELHVTASNSLLDLADFFGADVPEKIFCSNLEYPKGIAYKASSCDFVLSTRTTVGIEMMGVEAGMCGAQPIYPDTEFYRDIFDKTGVIFYDTENKVESLKDIISKGRNWTDEQVEAFRTKFSAEDNLPEFWDSVYSVCST